MADIGIGDLWKADVLQTILLAGGVGIVGGIARVARQYADPVTRTHVSWALFGSALILAAAAAIGALYVLTPESPLKFFAACVLAGYSGPALLDSLDNRLRLLVAETKTAKATSVAERAIAAATEGVKAAQGALPAAAPNATPSAEETGLADLKARVDGLANELAAIKGKAP